MKLCREFSHQAFVAVRGHPWDRCGDSESVESVEVVGVVAPGRGRRGKRGKRGRNPSMYYTRKGKASKGSGGTEGSGSG